MNHINTLRANLLHTALLNLIQIRYICPIIDLIGQIIVVFYGLMKCLLDFFTKQSQKYVVVPHAFYFRASVVIIGQ
jgi:hypothetical protein